MYIRRAVVGSLALGAAALAAGCGGAHEPERESQREPVSRVDPESLREDAEGMVAAGGRPAVVLPPRVPPPAGFRLRTVAESGVRIALPVEWFALRRHDVVFPGAAQTLLRTKLELGPMLQALAVPDSPLKLLGLDRRSPDLDRFVTLLDVQIDPRATFDVLAAKAADEVRRQRGFRPPLDRRRVLLPAGESLRLAYARTSRSGRLSIVQYVVPHGSRLYVLGFASTPARMPADARLFDASAQTLELTR